jgi:hypothetical protein
MTISLTGTMKRVIRARDVRVGCAAAKLRNSAQSTVPVEAVEASAFCGAASMKYYYNMYEYIFETMIDQCHWCIRLPLTRFGLACHDKIQNRLFILSHAIRSSSISG